VQNHDTVPVVDWVRVDNLLFPLNDDPSPNKIISSSVAVSLLMSKSAGLNEDMAKLEEDVRTVQQDIKSVEQKIERIEVAMDTGSTYMGISDPTLLFEEKKQLREEKNRLYDANNLLREEKNRLYDANNLLREKENQLRTLTIVEKQKPTVPGEPILFWDFKLLCSFVVVRGSACGSLFC